MTASADVRVNTLIAIAPRDRPTYTGRIMALAADYFAMRVGDDHPSIVAVRRCAMHVGYLVEGEARSAWEKRRASLGWWERIRTTRTAPRRFIVAYLASERASADRAFEQALELKDAPDVTSL